MRKLRRVGLILLSLVVLAGLVFLIIGLFKPRVAGIFIETTPTTAVFINGVEIGTTPYRSTTDLGEHVILLIPESFGVALSAYETKLTFTAGVETVLRREFGETDEVSAGEIISFEKVEKNETSLAVVSDPDLSQITIDGSDKSVTPYKTSAILPGEHAIVISKEGYLPRVVRVKTHKGYKLTAFVKLGKVGGEATLIAPTPAQEPEPTRVDTRKVEILQTDIGYLRVRQEPSTLGAEIGQVKPGKTYTLLAVDAKTGWFKIEFESGVGWISNQYAREVESESVTPTQKLIPSASPSATPPP